MTLAVDTLPADAQGDWIAALRETLAVWHPAAGRPTATPSPGLASRLAGQPPPQREPLLAILRQRLGSFPSEAVHPSWIAPLIPADPLLRRWCLGTMPPTVRRALVAELVAPRPTEVVFVDRTDAPSWFATWWTGCLWDALPYPAPLPGSRDEQVPVSLLWGLRDTDLATLLAALGLRFLANAVRALPSDELVAYVYTLPPETQSELVELAREGDPRSAAWSRHFAVLRQRWQAPTELAAELALLDLAANAAAAGRGTDARRITYRLPREQGLRLEAALGAPDPELAIPGADWHRHYRQTISALVKQRKIRLPDLREESMS